MNACNGIHEVFREGHLSKVLELITRGFNMNVRYAAGEMTYQEDPATGRYIEVCYMETPLTACVSNGKQNCVNLLIAAGTDVNFPDSLGLTPLMHAVVYDQPAIQTLLLYNRANVNSIDHFYETALVKAVIRGKFSAAVPLLEQEAEPNVLLWGNKTALHRAVEMQSIALTEALVIHRAEVTTEHLIEAAHHGNHHLLRVLLTRPEEGKIDERFNGEVALCESIWHAHHHCSRVLIEQGADVNALTNYGESTLLGATPHGDYELVKLLLKYGVYINLVNAQGQNSRTYNLAQNPSVHMEIEHILSVVGEFCFTVSCNGQNFVQKFTPTGVTLIPIRQDRPYAKKVRPLSIACKLAICHHLANTNSCINLFVSVPKLPLPLMLQKMLLNNMWLKD